MRQRDRKALSFLILLVVIISYNSSYAQSESIIQKCEFSEPKIIRNVSTFENLTYDSLEVKSLKAYGAPGEPVMPFKTIRFLIPQDSEPDSIEIITGKKITLDGNYRIEFGKKPVPLLLNYKLLPDDEPNMEIYSSANPFPCKLYIQMPLQNFRGYKILILNLHPVQYVPRDGIISYFTDMTVVVNLKPSLEISPFFRNLPKDKAEVLRKVDNPSMANTYTTKAETPHRGCICDPCDSYDYVIITNNALKNSTSEPNLQDLIDWKAQKGVSATIVTVEEIESDPDYEWDGAYGDGSSFFDDTAAHIRNFIKDAHINWDTDYILLAGDGDGADVGGESGDNIIPVRYFYAINIDGGTSDQIPADLYYAALDGNWNDDEDDKWGEYYYDEPDFKAEVYVGRAPVDSQEELSNFVMKTIAYETNFEPYLKNTLMVGEKLFDSPITWGGDCKDEVADGSSANYYTTVGFPEDFNVCRLYDRDYSGNDWPKTDVINLINNDIHLINHLGHSSVLYAMKLCNAPVYQEGPYCGTSGSTDVDDLTNTRYCFIYSQGCYSGAFDNWHYPYSGFAGYTKSDSIGEHFVTSEHGAFAVIMNSRYGFGQIGGTDGESQYYDREFWDAVFGEGITNLGRANQDSKEDNEDLLPYNIYMRWCYYELNLLGDPELELKTKLGYINVVADVNGCVEPFNDFFPNYLVFDINWDANGFADTNAMVIDYLPNSLDYHTSEPLGDYNSTDNTVTWFLGDIDEDDYGSMQITTKVNTQSCPCGKITNTACLEGDNYRSPAAEDVNVCFWGGDIIYVDKDANDANYNNGIGWDNAYTELSDALQTAGNCPNSFKSVWVAEGTYKPVYDTASGYKDKSFELLNNLALFGHFAGNETSPNQRDFADANNETILDGLIGQGSEKVNKIVKATGIDGSVVDGFTIQSAFQKGVYIDDSNIAIVNCEFWYNGDGIYCENSSELDIHNCLFINNWWDSLSVHENDSNTIVSNCIFDGNDYTSYGVYFTDASVELNDCIFKNHYENSIAGSRGSLTIKGCRVEASEEYGEGYGIYASGCDLEITGCTISNNTDGGLYVSVTGDNEVILKDSIIRRNGDYGVCIHNNNYSSDITVVEMINNWIHNNDGDGISFTVTYAPPEPLDLTIRNNTIYQNGGYGIKGTYLEEDKPVVNCIIYGNASGDFYGDFDNVNYCCLQDGDLGEESNITDDPNFMNIETDPNDLHISADSPCKDKGDSNDIPSGETDIDGEGRIKYGEVDMGADEYYWSPADFDLSGNVDFIDEAIFANAFRCTPTDANYVEKCDLEDNNCIDCNDLQSFCEDWLWEVAWEAGWMMCMGGGDGMSGGLMLDLTESLQTRPERLADRSDKFYAVNVYEAVSEQTTIYIDENVISEALAWLDKIWLESDELREAMTEEEFLEFRKALEEDLLRFLKGD